jgi:CRP/FNR family cyclic AMP-dependent transcriptional regulator
MADDAVAGPPAGSRIGDLVSDPTLGPKRLDLPEPQTLFEPDTPAQNIYFIETGQVRIYQVGPDGSSRLVDILGPGDWFGIAALAGNPGYSAQAVAVSPSVIWQVPAERLLLRVQNKPEVAAELIRQLAARLQAAHDAAAHLVFDDCNQRLVETLLRFSRTAAATPGGDGEVQLRITHQQLAQAVGAARETVSLAITQLRHQNLLRTGRNRLCFKPQVLQEFSQRSHAAPQPEPQSN